MTVKMIAKSPLYSIEELFRRHARRVQRKIFDIYKKRNLLNIALKQGRIFGFGEKVVL